MSAGRICSRVTYTATPEESVRVAAERMDERRVGTLVVLDDDQRPVGIVTDRDVAIRCVARKLDPDRTLLSEIMTVPVTSVSEDTPIETALGTMAGSGTRRSLVVDSDGRLVGVLALDDVVELLAEEAGAIGGLIRAQSPR